VETHLSGLFTGTARDSTAGHPERAGTQTAADQALAKLDLRGYAAQRNQVSPISDRGARRLSAWIRHGLLSLPSVARAAKQAPGSPDDRRRFIDELWWQEYARHLYARLGNVNAGPLRFTPPEQAGHQPRNQPPDQIWDREMLCIDEARRELEEEGFIVNQARMWLASHWTVRHGASWRDGEDWFFRHLLDGSRAANRLGWQWSIGAGTGKVYGFSRWQVNKRSPGLCERCPLQAACPIEEWPEPTELTPVEPDPLLRYDPDPALTAGPASVVQHTTPQAVWITAESLGDTDPAMSAHPHLPVIFVWDEALLTRLQLAGHRLVFLTQRLAEIATQRELQVWRGAPQQVIATTEVATTFAPVPGWHRIAAGVELAEVHPWPWLARPKDRTLASYTAWRKAVSGPFPP
jgi:deoxyribodipyrimidine photo-lyase